MRPSLFNNALTIFIVRYDRSTSKLIISIAIGLLLGIMGLNSHSQLESFVCPQHEQTVK